MSAQNSIEKIADDMRLPHDGFPSGLPAASNWSREGRVGAGVDTSHQDGGSYKAITAWGQVYADAAGNEAANTRVAIKDLQTWLLSHDGTWSLLQDEERVNGAAYAEDYVDDVSVPADLRDEPDGSQSVKLEEGHNFHFWPGPTNGRVPLDPNDVAGVLTTVDARLVLDDPNGPDDRAEARLMMSVGADYWLDETVGWDQWTTNADIGIGRLRHVGPEWDAFNMTTLSEEELRANPPPIDLGGGAPDYHTPREAGRDALLTLEFEDPDEDGLASLDMATFDSGAVLWGGGVWEEGAFTSEAVDLDGHEEVELSLFAARRVGEGRDEMRVELVSGDEVILLDEFAGAGSELTGSETGQRITESYEALRYDVDPALGEAAVRVSGRVSDGGEALHLDRVAIEGAPRAEERAPEPEGEAPPDEGGADAMEVFGPGEAAVLALAEANAAALVTVADLVDVSGTTASMMVQPLLDGEAVGEAQRIRRPEMEDAQSFEVTADGALFDAVRIADGEGDLTGLAGLQPDLL